MKKIIFVFFFLFLAGCQSNSSNDGPSSNAFSATPIAPGKVALSWTASTGSPQGYLVEQSTDDVTFTQVQSVTTTSTVATNLTIGTTYFFRVRAYNAGGNSAYSGVATATP